MSMNNNSMKFLQLAAGAASLTALSGCTKDSSSTDCAAGKVRFGKECVDKCAANKTFASATNTTCVDKKPELKKCTKTDQCKDGEECKDGKCQSKCPEKEHFDANEKRCVKDDDHKKCSEKQPCPEGQVCTDGTCVDPAAADDCQDLWHAARKVVYNSQTKATVSELASLFSAYKRCFTCMDKDDKASKYVKDVDEKIQDLGNVTDLDLQTIHRYVKILVETWSEELPTEDAQKKARQDVFAASSTCNGPNEEDFKFWVGYSKTKTYLVDTTKAMTEEEYQDLINNLD